MKPDHPSNALPSTARIHFGRAYTIDHDLPVQSLGLVHPTYMEILLDQFNAKVYERTMDGGRVAKRSRSVELEVSELEHNVKAADMDTAREIRNNISGVLGTELFPAEYPPCPASRRTRSF
jgi:hypothetical protein